MKAKLYSYEVLIGETELSVTDESMEVISGKLTPTDWYFDIEHIFLKRYDNNHEEFKKLKLNLQLDNGCFIMPNKIWVEVFENSKENITIYGLGISQQVVEDYFKHTPPKPFLEVPWYTLGLLQKISLEKELLKEISHKEGLIWDNVTKQQLKNHYLENFTCFAYADYGPDDDVLFEIEGENSDYTFAVVHLTWSGKKENYIDCPNTYFFKDFNSFMISRGLPDINEWED